MSDTCPTKNPLQRDGTSQYQRMLEALKPGYAPVHEFSLKDWMLFAWHYSKRLNYYNANNSEVPQSDWTNFLLTKDEISRFIAVQTKEGAEAIVEPHLALFFSFIKLMQSPQEQLNDLTRRHLDFYYKKVLLLRKKEAVEDKVHLVFELAKNIVSHKLDDDTLFDAGKDAKGKPLNYIIGSEPVFYQAKTSLLSSVYYKKDRYIRYAAIADSLNGSGAPLDKDNPLWYAFGFDRISVGNDSPVYIKLPSAKIGFALASSVLLLKEGERTITVTLDLAFPASTDFSAFTHLQEKKQFIILLTGEKDWVSPARIEIDKIPSSNNQSLEFTVFINQSEKAIVAYDSKLHKENYKTVNPVMRVLLETEAEKGYESYAAFSRAIVKKASIRIKVTAMKDLIVENDDGKLDPAKPFLPFGAVPKKGSNFYIGSPEIFQKNWSSIDLDIAWKNKPEDFAEHYIAYKQSFLGNDFTRNSYHLTLKNLHSADSDNDSVVKGDGYFKANVSYIKKSKWSSGQEKELFTENPLRINKSSSVFLNPVVLKYGSLQLYAKSYTKNISYIQNYLEATPFKPLFTYATFNADTAVKDAEQDRFTVNTKDNFIRLELSTDFFHGNYPVLYAAALTRPGVVIPKEPYTPMIASLNVTYEASVENDFSIADNTNQQKLNNYQRRDIQLFHEIPFGQSEQHVFLKEQQPFLAGRTAVYLANQYTTEGEFYIGVKDLITETNLSILFQVAEGSENPLSATFQKDKGILWYILCNNEWKYLNDDFIISDSTNNFLRSGIITFLIPKEANSGNTAFPAECFWLKAELPGGIGFDSVCKFVAVVAQATESVFINNDNELSHLNTALSPGSISKMVNRQAPVKTVLQPFSSFGGKPEETDEHFYLRVSERLRHKNRAVNIWDYERLVLEKFPSVYKVKCLNHTSSDFELAPGFIRILPVPDLRNKNIYDIFQPRVSKNTLSDIQEYLNGLHGFHIDCKAENPKFEEVQFRFSVKFYPGIDPKTYLKILEEDLKKYLSPWAFDDYAEVQFGGSIYKHKAIAFIEERKYVDFIAEFRMYNLAMGLNDKDEITADDSRAILTSAKKHIIDLIDPPVCS